MSSLGSWTGLGGASDDDSDTETGVGGKEIGAAGDAPPAKRAKVAKTDRKIHAVYTVNDIETELGSHGKIKICDCVHKKSQLGGCLWLSTFVATMDR